MSKTKDTLITQTAFASIQALSGSERQQALRALKWLEDSPEPDGNAKRMLPFPHKEGTCGAFYADFMIIYTIRDKSLTIIQIVKSLDDIEP